MRLLLRVLFCFAVTGAISSPLALAKEPIKLNSANDFNKQPSSMVPNFSTQSKIATTTKTSPPSGQTQGPVGSYYSPSIPSPPKKTSASLTTTPASPAPPSSTPTSNGGLLLGPSGNSSKNTDPSANSWFIY